MQLMHKRDQVWYISLPDVVQKTLILVKVLGFQMLCQLMSREYPSEMASRPLLMGPKKVSYSLPVFLPACRNLEQSIGTRVRAAVVETIMMIATIHPSCLKRIPAIPDIIVRGTNTQSMVRVEAMTEIPTSEVA